MFRTPACLFAFCFTTIGMFASVGFSQELYQSHAMYYQPDISRGYPVQQQTYNSQAYSIQQPVQFQAAFAMDTQASSYGSWEKPTGNYGSVFQGVGLVSQGFLPDIASKDIGYIGPGDMRTHLWNDHGEDLRSNGVSQSQLNSMPMADVQKWHNFFHGTEGKPDQ